MAVVNLQALNSRLGYARLAALFMTCLAFSLVVHSRVWWGQFGSWCLFAWCFSFATIALVLLLEVAGLTSKAPVSWREAPVALAAFSGLLCLSASIIYPVRFVNQDSRQQEYTVTATVASCLATVAYAVQVWLSKARPGEVTGYLATVPGLLKVVEAFAAGVIFAFVGNTSYDRYPALQWCLAVYCICFILAALLILLFLTGRSSWLPTPLERWLGAYALLGVLLYATATILWPLFCFDRRYGHSSRPHNCGRGCYWDSQVAVAVLTAFNLLVYVADLIHSGRLVFIRTH
ncbi:myeloid-associated differentiation marker homolog [Hemitrygon akajei]|uniref:myeloid-associated differentiation marker homolog n=1 Tax=Hemitrygon akajei TaxID=2704970 RepID=UPI003BFA1CAC